MSLPNNGSLPNQDKGSEAEEPSDVRSTLEMDENRENGIETPRTEVSEVPLKPDISIFCEKIKSYIDIRDIQDHRNYLRALTTMRYKDGKQPEGIGKLFHRRNNLIKQLRANDEKIMDPKDVQKINDAYEVLKSNLEQTFESHRKVRKFVDTNVNGISLNCSPQCVQAVGICSSANENWKNEMEDTRVYQDCFGGDPAKCFMAIFDGHHGKFAAEVAATELHHLLLYEMSKFDPRTRSLEASNLAEESILSRYVFERPATKESERVTLFEESVDIVQQIIKMCQEKYETLMKEKTDLPSTLPKENLKHYESQLSENILISLKKVHHLIDILLSYGKDEFSKVRWSGCSTLNILVQDFHKRVSFKGEETHAENKEDPGNEDVLGILHLANAGNVRALLIRGNRPYQLSKDHTPNNPKEMSRILKDGAVLSESKKDVLVNGVMATTRGLGNHGDLKLKKSILVEPYTTCVPIDRYAQLLVMASNGVWEVFNNNEVTSLLVQLLPNNRIPPPDRISSSLKLLFRTMSQVSRSPSSATNEQKNIIRNRRQPPASVSSSEAEFSPRTTKESQKLIGHEEDIPEDINEEANAKNTSDWRGDNGYHGDMNTEAGSVMGDNDDNESGHDGDVDTCGDLTSRLALSRLSQNLPISQEEVQREIAKSMAEYLVQAALLAGAKDNITVFVALLPGSGL